MIPNVANVLTSFEQPVILKTVTRTTSNFQPVITITSTNILAVVQPAKAEDLTAENIDWSLKYFQFHSKTAVSIGQFINHNGVDYKIIQSEFWNDYGYYRSFGEEVKGAIR